MPPAKAVDFNGEIGIGVEAVLPRFRVFDVDLQLGRFERCRLRQNALPGRLQIERALFSMQTAEVQRNEERDKKGALF